MRALEFALLAERISRLWPPAMDAATVDEYWRILEPLGADQVGAAITLIARQPRQYRPDAGLVYETAAGKPGREALPPADIDPLSAADHRAVMEELKQRQTAEHRRRHEAVVALLRSTGYRVPLAELPALMATSRCSAEEFDERMAGHRALAPQRLVADR